MISQPSGTLAFDFDGTLVDSLQASVATFRESCAYVGEGASMLETSPEAFVGYFKSNVFEQLLATGVEPDVLMAVLDRLQVLQAAAYAEVNAFEGALEALMAISELDGVSLACVSSNREAVIRPWFESHAPELLAQVQMLGAESGHDKAEKLRSLISHEGHQVVFVTDTIGDVREGLAAGVHTLGVGWGWHDADALAEAGAHGILSSSQSLLGDLKRHIDALTEG